MTAPANRIAGLLPYYSWVPCANAGCPAWKYVCRQRRKARRKADPLRYEKRAAQRRRKAERRRLGLDPPPTPEQTNRLTRERRARRKRHEARLRGDSPPPQPKRAQTWESRTRHELLAVDPRCAYCRCRLTPQTATLDHLRPKARGGGRHQRKNVVLACEPCNVGKGRLLPGEWYFHQWRTLFWMTLGLLRFRYRTPEPAR